MLIAQLSQFLSLSFSFNMKSAGGVVMASQDGKIVCENTLDARLDVVFRKKLPEVCFHNIYVYECLQFFSCTRLLNIGFN